MNDVTGVEFLANAHRWLGWVESMQPGAKRMVEIAKGKPGGLHQDGNLILDSEGNVWESTYGARRGYVRLERDAVFGPYRRTTEVIEGDERAYNGGPEPFEVGGRTFVAKGWDQPEADWTWMPPRYGERGTLYYAEASLRSNEAGQALGAALLALAPEDLDGWAKARAQNAPHDGWRRSDAHVGEDWASLSAHLGLPSHEDVPDYGSLLCFAHLLVDRAAGLLATSYAH